MPQNPPLTIFSGNYEVNVIFLPSCKNSGWKKGTVSIFQHLTEAHAKQAFALSPTSKDRVLSLQATEFSSLIQAVRPHRRRLTRSCWSFFLAKRVHHLDAFCGTYCHIWFGNFSSKPWLLLMFLTTPGETWETFLSTVLLVLVFRIVHDCCETFRLPFLAQATCSRTD